MVLFNYATKEITAKIVYYGPGLCGKTTNLQFIYDSLPSSNRSKMLSLATETDRTLFFDFLPIELGRIRGMRARLQLYTVPGQVYYNSTRQLVLRGADGVVFVADSQEHALEANAESLQNLEENLRKQSVRIADVPLVIQYNKRDLPNALPIPELEAKLNRFGVPSFASVATTGEGVEETLNGVARAVFKHLVHKYGLQGESEEPEIQVLGAPVKSEKQESVWSDTAEALTEPAAIPDEPFPPVSEVPAEYTAASLMDESGGDGDALPFSDLIQRFELPAGDTAVEIGRAATAAPVAEIELPLVSAEAPGPGPVTTAPSSESPRSDESLVREITLPLNLTADELQRHRKLRLRINLEVNLLK